MEIRIKYLRDIEPIKQAHGGEWYDLRIAEETELRAGDFKLIPLGVAIRLPDRYEAIVAPRSSTFKNLGVMQANSIGVIDNAYSGNKDEWHFPAYATRDIRIPKNTRICQFRILKQQPECMITEVDDLGDNNRGGLGSTGLI